MSSLSRSLSIAVLCAASLIGACSDATTSSIADTAIASTATPGACTVVQTIGAGQVVTGLSGTVVCVGSVGASAEYALVVFNGATTSSTATVEVSGTGLVAPTGSSAILSSAGAATVLSSGLSAPATAYRASRAFEIGLRARERAALSPLLPSARAWARSRALTPATFDVIPASVSTGQLLRLNANSSDACSSPSYRTGRVVAVTTKAIVVADTGNPAGGFTDADYPAFGARFDTLVDPLDRDAFGDPSDIDGNGRILIFFTKTVNDLTPRSSSTYVGGFFFSRDLFPTTSTANSAACAGSNMGEMFYVMVPDPTRAGPFTKPNVSTEVTATLAHEYEHLINASRRMYVNTSATDFEETWLDEGLAHVAEELLFYRAAGLAPRQNLDATTLRASSVAVAAFNSYQGSNFGRYEEYLLAPTDYSPYADNDSLATRGASWAFLRYAADHHAATDASTWYDLVNPTTTGLSNLQNVFGTNVAAQLRDWGVSVLADDVAGVGSAY